jgi:hypothetical protein
VLWYGRMLIRAVVGLAMLLAFFTSGCSKMRDIVGLPGPGDPSVTLKAAETRWLLVQNPRFGDVPSEPEYIWVEEDNVPLTLKTLVRGKKSIIAPPEIVAKYGPPPGGGKISARQGVPYQATAAADGDSRPVPATASAAGRAARPGAIAPAPAPELPKRGYVVYVDTTRIVIDLNGADGVRPGSVVSVRRDRIPILHPVTGEVLGELDEEVATARVIETREKFSVAEVQTTAPNAEIRVKDRVVLK